MMSAPLNKVLVVRSASTRLISTGKLASAVASPPIPSVTCPASIVIGFR
jgi:hypothetical protein